MTNSSQSDDQFFPTRWSVLNISITSTLIYSLIYSHFSFLSFLIDFLIFLFYFISSPRDMSDEEYDITGALALAPDSPSSSLDVLDALDLLDGEIQDVISDNDEEVANSKKPTKKRDAAFPSLELSDDEDEPQTDLTGYFASNNPTTKKAKAGSFPSFGLNKTILQNIAKKGYRQPTPIQRKTIPLIMEGRDVVGMARTGSGKTAAFTLPMVERLRSHSAKTGVRAIILSPLRELALQTFKQVREFSRGTDLRSIVLIGGDSLDDQFLLMMSNPDVVVATPGRFLHLKVEMDLDLKTVEFICFDEADRLFEMGFAEQLNELIAALPLSRQSLLFSATLPRSLVDFAKAGLTSPVLVRLDAETKISDQLQMAFVSTKRNERDANLLYILQHVIKMEVASPEQAARLAAVEKRAEEEDEEEEENKGDKKRKRFRKERLPPANQVPSEKSTIVFVPTKHHVEYVSMLLRDAGYLVSYIYGTLDQHARKNQLYQFRVGLTTVLVVTDVAARGIDIPVLANVINYTLPASSKIFVHRVGRTARAGNAGWAYSIVGEKELPYLLDLELFLGKKVMLTSMHEQREQILREKGLEPPRISYTERLVLGAMPRDAVEIAQEVSEGLLTSNYDLRVIRDVAAKGEKLYHRTRQPASVESVRRSKELVQMGWDDQHLLVGPNLEREKERLLAKLGERTVKETVFEFRNKGHAGADDDGMASLMARRRRALAPIQRRAHERRALLDKERMAGLTHGLEEEVIKGDGAEVGYTVNEDELRNAFEDGEQALKKRKTYRDPQFFMSHYAPASVIQDQQLSLSNSFANDAAQATFDLGSDEKANNKTQVMQWDRKKGNYVNSQSTDKKYIIGESGQRLPATYRSGRFDEWKRNNKGVAPGDVKLGNAKFKHNTVKAPKLPDKYRDDYAKQKKKVEKAVESGTRVKGWNKPGQQQELRSTEQIRKNRADKEKRRQKTGRHKRK